MIRPFLFILLMESGSKYFLFTVNDIPDLNLCLLMETIIEAKGIEKSFGKLKVLRRRADCGEV